MQPAEMQQLSPKIAVIGVGGAGGNAVNNMIASNLEGCDFVVCNTDAQALEHSLAEHKIQLGTTVTGGLGAGSKPEVGQAAAEESLDDVLRYLDGANMAFVTAGMGGGTGTGAAPVIAKLAKDKDILTVGIVTIPFKFEGKMRNTQARVGVEKLRSHVDSLIVINNDKLREVYGNLGFKAGFSKADEVLSTASRGIAEVITHHYTQNIDLRDAKTVLSNSGTAIMGSANASGANRASEAIMKALDSPLLNDNKIAGAKNVLLLIVSGSEEITIDEIGEINDHIQTEAGGSANIIMGVGEDETLEDAVSVTIIATGFDVDQQDEIVNTESKKVIHTLEDDQPAVQNLTTKSTSVVTPNIPVQKPVEETPKKAEVIRHSLLDDTATVNLIPTSEIIKNINVVYEEVKAPQAQVEEEFIITSMTDEIRNIEVNEPEFVVAETKEEEEENQIAFTFDMPLANPTVAETKKEENTIKFELTSEEVNAIEVNDHVEVIPVTEVHDKGVTRYSLDDYMEEEAISEKNIPQAAEDGIVFEKKIVAEPIQESQDTAEADPFNATIEESLKNRADERRKKLKEFNYKFNNSVSRIEEIEKQPAYKRAGIELNENNLSDTASRTSLGTDSNDDMQLRNNNSFLHDNVD